MTEIQHHYPDLNQLGSEYRLTRISQVEDFLKSEIEFRQNLCKKYTRAANVIDGVCGVASVVTLGTGVAGTALLTSGIGAIPGMVLECVSAVNGLVDLIGIFVSRQCKSKSKKHNEIQLLASSKLNSIHSHVSKAMTDNTITNDEFILIMEELDNYIKLKNEIRSKTIPQDKTKSDLMQEAKEILLQKFKTLQVHL